MSLRYLKSAIIVLLFLGALHPIASAQGRCRAICYTTYDEDFFYCEVLPKVLVAQSCSSGDPSKDASGGCHVSATSFRVLPLQPADMVSCAVVTCTTS